MPEMLTLDAFEQASEKVKEVTQKTELVESPHFSQATGNRVFFKPENMQRTGAYKVRGAYYKISTLAPEELERGII
ncbi:pyridoxal-phosphate dependent enzyme, partial [Enorma massiliensis]